MSAPKTGYLSRLKEAVADAFNLNELHSLCLELAVDYDTISGSEKIGKVTNLILYYVQQQRLEELVGLLREVRPYLQWEDPPNKRQLLLEVAEFERPMLAAVPPPPPDKFVGRQQILSELNERIQGVAGTSFIFALHGMGGIGKTATALKLAHDLRSKFPGGIFWAGLNRVSGNAIPILQAWSQLCQIDSRDLTNETTLTSQLRGILASRQSTWGPIMVFIDDVRQEWLKGFWALKEALPEGVPILMTTRDGELAANLGATVFYLQALSVSEALLLLRKLSDAPQVSVEPEAARALLEFLGYLPLAIKLAASQISRRKRKQGFRLAEFANTVQRQAIEDLPNEEGHPGLKAAFDISFHALPPDAQRVFRALGVFSTGLLRLKSVSSVLDKKEEAVESTMDILVDFALIDYGEDEGFYALHPLLQQYAQTLLQQENEAMELEVAHLDYYWQFVQRHEEYTPENQRALSREWGNIQVAAARAGSQADWEKVIGFALSLEHFINAYGKLTTAEEQLDKAIEYSSKHQHDLELKYHPTQARLMQMDGVLAYLLNDYKRARHRLEEAGSHCLIVREKGLLPIEKSLSLARRIAYHLGLILVDGYGDFQGAIAQFTASRDLAQELQDTMAAIMCEQQIASCQSESGNFEQAEAGLLATLAQLESQRPLKLRGQTLEAYAYYYLGINSHYTGNWEQAEAHYHQALERAEAFSSNLLVMQTLANLADLACDRHKVEEANDHFVRAEAMAQRYQYKRLLVFLQQLKGKLEQNCP